MEKKENVKNILENRNHNKVDFAIKQILKLYVCMYIRTDVIIIIICMIVILSIKAIKI